MTRDDIIRLADEAGLTAWEEPLQRFAALVAAAETKGRQVKGDWIAELCPEIEDWQVRLIQEHIAKQVLQEREACAKVCEETTAAWTQHVYNGACVDCAVAIRARGNK